MIAEPKVYEYKTSPIEMKRRKKAFITFAISLFLSICIFLIDYITSAPGVLLPIITFLAILLVFAVIAFNKFEKRTSLRIYLSERAIEWKSKNQSKQYMLADIKGLRIKRKSKGTIREIKIHMRGSNSLYINGLDDLCSFEANLLSKIQSVNTSTFREPIDFDHPWFYAFFGTFIGLCTTALFRLLALMSVNHIRNLQIFVACFTVGLGSYWIWCKPIKGSYGAKHADIIFGISLIVIGGLIFYLAK